MDTKIFQITHREIEEPIWLSDLYDAVQVGSGATFCPHRDTECEGSISLFNKLYCEETGTYWIWKEGSKGLDIVGQCQYRRRLKFNDAAEVEKIFNNFDCILPEPLRMGITVWGQYVRCHNVEDMVLAERIIAEKWPEFSEGFDAYIKKSTVLYYSAGYVMRKADFDAWCGFYFSFSEEFLKRKGWSTVEEAKASVRAEMEAGKRGRARGVDYQVEVLGFLAERLFTIWVRTRFRQDRILHMPYSKFDGV